MASDGKHNPSSMLSAIQSVLALLISYCLFIMANGLFITLLGVRTSIEGFSPGIAGVIVACYFSGLFLGARYAVRFVRIAGYIRAFAGFASVMSISALLHVIWIDPYAWMLIRMLAGFCMAGMIMITESWLNQRASNEMRGQLLSLYMITNYLGGGVGQFLLPLADPSQFQLFSLVSIIFSAALLPILLTRAEAPPSPKVGPVNLRQLIRLSPVGVFGTFCVGWVSASNNGLGPLFAHAAGMSLGDTSIFMFCLIFSGLLLQYPVGRLSDRFDRRGVLFLVTFVTVCMASMMVLAIRYIDSYGMLPIFAICVFYGSTFYTLYSISTSHIADHAAAAEVSMVNVASSVLVVYAAGAIIGPIISGQMMQRIGPSGLFINIAVTLLILCVYILYRSTRRTTVSSEDKQPFVPMPGTQFAGHGLYHAARRELDRALSAFRNSLWHATSLSARTDRPRQQSSSASRPRDK